MNSGTTIAAIDHGDQALPDRVGAERRIGNHLALGRLIKRGGQTAAVDDVGQLVGVLLVESAGSSLDDAVVGDAGIDRGRRLQDVVQHDRQLVLECSAVQGHVIARQIAESLAAIAVEAERDFEAAVSWSSSAWALRRSLPVTLLSAIRARARALRCE